MGRTGGARGVGGGVPASFGGGEVVGHVRGDEGVCLVVVARPTEVGRRRNRAATGGGWWSSGEQLGELERTIRQAKGGLWTRWRRG